MLIVTTKFVLFVFQLNFKTLKISYAVIAEQQVGILVVSGTVVIFIGGVWFLAVVRSAVLAFGVVVYVGFSDEVGVHV